MPPAAAGAVVAPGATAGSLAGTLWAFTSGMAGFRKPDSGDVENGGRMPVAAPSPNVPGRQAIRVSVPSGAKRSEVEPTAGHHFTAGQHIAFGLSDFLPAGFPVNADGFQVIWQLHDGGTNSSPPVALEVTSGHLWLSNVGKHVADLGPVSAGKNLAVGLDIQFARKGGTVSVTREGRQIVTNLKPPEGTMVDSYDYLKVGDYKHQDSSDPDATLFINDLRICPGGVGGTVPAACQDLAGR